MSIRRSAGPEPCEARPAATFPDRDRATEIAARLKAISNPVRLQVLALVLSADADGARVPDIEPHVGVSASTISHHLGILLKAGLVTRRQEGPLAYYGATPAAAELMRLVQALAGTPER